MEIRAVQRTFIVGCPRSGTTVVQTLLARHTRMCTPARDGFL
ncbi:sulfotransferase [Rhodanobacter glycinis]